MTATEFLLREAVARAEKAEADLGEFRTIILGVLEALALPDPGKSLAWREVLPAILARVEELVDQANADAQRAANVEMQRDASYSDCNALMKGLGRAEADLAVAREALVEMANQDLADDEYRFIAQRTLTRLEAKS